MQANQLDMRWDPGAEECAPPQRRTQLHAIDDATVVVRQNPCVEYEAPLMYLRIGGERALLIDSGASAEPADTAELTRLVGGYLVRADGSRLPLVVAHTHGHQDHRAGDAAFADLPDTTVVPHEHEALRQFFYLRLDDNDEIKVIAGLRSFSARRPSIERIDR